MIRSNMPMIYYL